MAKKKKTKKKNEEYKQSKFRFGNTIWTTLMTGLLIVVGVIIFFSFTISLEMVNSVQTNAQLNFYENAFNTSSKGLFGYLDKDNINKSEFDEYLMQLKYNINSKLVDKFKIADIFITKDSNNRLTPVIYTTMQGQEDKYILQQGGIIPFKIERSSRYTVAEYGVLPLTQNSNYKSYKIYLVVPKITYGEINPETGERRNYKAILINQLMQIYTVIIIICVFFIFFLVRSITGPLKTMQKTVSEIAKGELSGRLEYTRYDEINQLVGAYNLMANALQRLYSSLDAQVKDRTRELKGAYAELQNTQAMMVHSEKMKSLGELVAGIMHEINNPINFIYGNMTHLNNYAKDLIKVIDEYTKYETSLKDNEKNQITKLKKDCDYEFLKTDLPDLIKSCKEGAERAKNIIQDLKSFSRMEEVSIKDIDLPVEIDTVLNILHNKIKNKAEVHKEYINNVPKVEAFGGQLNQVFMNILDNAAGAIENRGDIWIRINKDNKNLIVEIEDNGMGMDEETQRKVFDPFFTTKPVGQGTGLGMSITYKIIKNHQGDIKVESKKGKGTKFIITLPLNIDRDKLNAGTASGDNNG